MHQNTLVYRLKKIVELVSINYDDFNERQHILLSYELREDRSRILATPPVPDMVLLPHKPR